MHSSTTAGSKKRRPFLRSSNKRGISDVMWRASAPRRAHRIMKSFLTGRQTTDGATRARKGYPALRVVSIALMIAAWALLVQFKVYRFGFIPSPSSVVRAAADYLPQKNFFLDAA